MKKYIAFLLCLIMILSLISCNFNDDKDDLSSNENGGLSDVDDGSTNDDNVTPSVSEAEKAMQAYEAAIKGEIYVVDEQFGEISLNDCRFLTNNVTVGECKFINKAILDMDGDGINEYVIQAQDEADHIVLHYYDGKVYSYSFGVTEFRHLNTNGTFYWLSNSNYWVGGLSRLVFNGSSISIEKMYEVNIYEDEDKDAYYIEGKPVTREEFGEQYDYYKYYSTDCIVRKSFSPLEIDCSYPISSERALEIASEYWEISDWYYERAMGTTIADRIVLSSKPSDENGYYIIRWKIEHYWHAYPCWEGRTPGTTYIHKEIIVDAFTGECRNIFDGKG